jgi:hypothetical protein
MKVRMNRLLMPFAVLLVFAASDAMAQKLVADIPFSFTACTQEMPSGRYNVRPMTSATDKLLLIRSDDSKSGEIVCTQAVQSRKPASGGKLVFNRYGDQYFLAEIWFAGELSGNQVVKSEREEALIKEFGINKKRGRVTIRITETKPE